MTIREQILDDIRHGGIQTAADLQGVSVDELREYLGMDDGTAGDDRYKKFRQSPAIIDHMVSLMRAGESTRSLAIKFGTTHHTAEKVRKVFCPELEGRSCFSIKREKALDMMRRGAGVRETAIALGLSADTVYRLKNKLGGNDETI